MGLHETMSFWESHCLVHIRCSITNSNFLPPFWNFYLIFHQPLDVLTSNLDTLYFLSQYLKKMYFQSNFRMCLPIGITNPNPPSQSLAVTKGSTVFLAKENTLNVNSIHWAFAEPVIRPGIVLSAWECKNASKTF